MESNDLPEISSLPSLPRSTQHHVLDTLFEPSEYLHDLGDELFAKQHQQQRQQQQVSYATYQSLIDGVGSRLRGLAAGDSAQERATLFEILGSHPRLGEKSQAKLSDLSRQEQTNLRSEAGQKHQSERRDGSEEGELRRLNGVYEERFPGLRYVVFVKGRGRGAILQDMRRRIERSDLDLEISENIQAMCDIAADRALKLQNQPSSQGV